MLAWILLGKVSEPRIGYKRCHFRRKLFAYFSVCASRRKRESKVERPRESEQEREKSRVRVKKRFAYLHSSMCVSTCTYGGKERMGQRRRREVVCVGVAIMMLFL